MGAARAAQSVQHLADDVGIPSSLSAFGLREHHVPRVVEEAMKSGNVAVNPRRTSSEQLAEILRSTLEAS